MKNKSFLTVLCTFLATTLIWASVYSCTVMKNPVVKKVLDAYDLIEKNFIFEYDEEYMKDLAISAMVIGLGDKYSNFYPKEYYQNLRESMDGHYYGIGVTITGDAESGEIFISEINEGSPAESAGILPGDILIEVNDTPVGIANYREAIDMVKGESDVEGKEVKLKLIRAETGIEYTVWVRREKIVSHTVSAEKLAGGIVYVRISDFDNETPAEFLEKLDDIGVENIQGIVLDLRDNGGGTLYAAHTIADMLMPGAVLCTFKYKDGSTSDLTTSDNQLIKAPVCIIVNGGTASASEVITSGLRDNGRAKVIGEQTFGKAIAQKSFPFETENGQVVSSLYITHASYLTPDGKDIHGKGIEPDYIVKTPEEYKEIPVTEWERDKDVQLAKALEVIKKEIK